MKVKDLIAELQKHDPQAEICVYSSRSSAYFPIVGLEPVLPGHFIEGFALDIEE